MYEYTRMHYVITYVGFLIPNRSSSWVLTSSQNIIFIHYSLLFSKCFIKNLNFKRQTELLHLQLIKYVYFIIHVPDNSKIILHFHIHNINKRLSFVMTLGEIN